MARLSDQEIKRRYEEQLGVFRGSISDDEAEELWPDLPLKERNRRRRLKETQQARYHTVVDDDTDQRMMGGPQVSGSTKKNIMEAVSDAANGARQKEVMDALFAPLSDESNAVRGKGAERIIKIAAEQVEIERRDRQELHQLGKDDLVERLVKAVLNSGTADTLFEKLQLGTDRDRKAISATAQDVQDAAA